jgi:integrase
MSHASSHGAKSRRPVLQGQRKIVGLWERQTAAGATRYESLIRIDGKQKRVIHDAENKSAAIVAHNRLKTGVADGEVQIGDRTLTVKVMCDSFLQREEGPLGKRSASTVALYRSRLERHVYPRLGSMKADAVRVEHVRALIDGLTEKGYSGSLVRNCLSALSASFRHGRRDLGAVRRNPVTELDRGDRPSNTRRTEPRYLSIEELELLLGALSDESRPIAATLALAGLRISEALDLRWSGIDFETATIDVPGTKSAASKGDVPLVAPLARELRAHRERQAALGFGRIHANARVFQTASGKPVLRGNALRAIKAAGTAAGLNGEGLEPIGNHDLRHTCAMLAYDAKLTDLEVSQLLRHTNVQITRTTYLRRKDAATKLGGRLAAGGFGS